MLSGSCFKVVLYLLHRVVCVQFSKLGLMLSFVALAVVLLHLLQLGIKSALLIV